MITDNRILLVGCDRILAVTLGTRPTVGFEIAGWVLQAARWIGLGTVSPIFFAVLGILYWQRVF